MEQEKIGQFLRTLRKEKNLTQEQLAEHFQVSGRTVSRWENGNHMPDISVLIEIADFYAVDIREILDGERKPAVQPETGSDTAIIPAESGRTELTRTDLRDVLIKAEEYSNAEKDSLLTSLLTGIILSAASFLLLFFILLFLTHGLSNRANSGAAIFVTLFGFALMLLSIIHVLQIKGRISRKSSKTLRRIGIPVCIVSLILSIAVIFAVTNAVPLWPTDKPVYEKLKHNDTALSEYGNWYGLFAHSNLLVFPESIPQQAADPEYRFYNNDSVFGPSGTVFLKCTYDDAAYQNEIRRLEQIKGIRKDTEHFSTTAYIALMQRYESEEAEYALTFDDNTIVYLCITEGVKPWLPDPEYLRSGAPADSERFTIYGNCRYPGTNPAGDTRDVYKFWPVSWTF